MGLRDYVLYKRESRIREMGTGFGSFILGTFDGQLRWFCSHAFRGYSPACMVFFTY